MLKSWGFTLIELIITIAVLAIIATFAVPAFSGLIAKQNLNKSTQELRAVFVEARGKAVVERRNITVVLNSSAVNTDNQFNWNPSGQSVLKNGNNSVTFQLNGTINSNTDISFQLCEAIIGAKVSRSFSLSRMGILEPITEGTCT